MRDDGYGWIMLSLVSSGFAVGLVVAGGFELPEMTSAQAVVVAQILESFGERVALYWPLLVIPIGFGIAGKLAAVFVRRFITERDSA